MNTFFSQVVGKIVTDEIFRELKQINRKLGIIMALSQEAIDKLQGIQTSITKIGGETSTLLTKIQELQDAAKNNVPDDVMTKINEVASQAQVVDDLVPDVTSPTP